MTTARQFRVRFQTASLQLQSCSDDGERATNSTEQRAVLQTLLAEAQPLQKVDHDALAELVLNTKSGWLSSDLSSLLESLDAKVIHRREEQKWCESLLGIFLAEEWNRWKSAGLSALGEILEEIPARVKALGGKHLC